MVDATYGGGGHSRLILEKIGSGKLFAFDQDENAAGNIVKDDRLFFIRHNFRYLKNFLRYFDAGQVDAVFADLGVSSHDFDVAERGFSFRFDEKLDMRMNLSLIHIFKPTQGVVAGKNKPPRIGDVFHSVQKSFYVKVINSLICKRNPFEIPVAFKKFIEKFNVQKPVDITVNKTGNHFCKRRIFRCKDFPNVNGLKRS